MIADSENGKTMRAPAPAVVVIGGSAGSLEALSSLVGALPYDLPAAVFVVVHILPVAKSRLPQILARRCSLPTRHARDGDPVRPGEVLVAPPDQHLLIRRGRVELNRGPRENSTRPAIDPLFRSAAEAYGPDVIGVVLSGNLDDGSQGLRQIMAAGGIAIVQEPQEALHSEMPCNALALTPTARVLASRRIGQLIGALADGDRPGNRPREVTTTEDTAETARPGNGGDRIGAGDSPGEPTGLTCPECHGVLWASPDPTDTSLHCRIGHTFSLETLQSQRRLEIEGAMGAAVRALHEESSLARHIAAKATQHGRQAMAQRFSTRAEAAMGHARVLENLLSEPVPLPTLADSEEEVVRDAS